MTESSSHHEGERLEPPARDIRIVDDQLVAVTRLGCPLAIVVLPERLQFQLPALAFDDRGATVSQL